MGRLFVLVALFALAWTAQAETYKWVDERGVTNYSNSPPPAKHAKAASQVEDRISTYHSDPELNAAAKAASLQYSQAAEAEWLQRQRLMAMKEAANPPCPYPYSDCYEDPRASTLFPYAYVLPVAAPRPFVRVRTFHHHRVRTTAGRSMFYR